MKTLFTLAIVLLGMPLGSRAINMPGEPQGVDSLKSDSLCTLLHKRGHFEGHVRSFTMATHNWRANSPDYLASALGLGIRYSSPSFRGFQFTFSGFVIQRLFSNNLHPESTLSSRYEAGLFDVTHPGVYNDMDRLEEFYLSYSFGSTRKHQISAGRFVLNTALINEQDGRMRPNLQQGLWTKWSLTETWKVEAGWINRTSPRSTVHWYSMGNSLGLFDQGVNNFGQPSAYKNGIEIPGVVAVLANRKTARNTFHAGIYEVVGLFHLVHTEVMINPGWINHRLKVFGQVLYQHGASGRNEIGEARYLEPNSKSLATSGRIRLNDRYNAGFWEVNATYLFPKDRFLLPREWGREPFFGTLYRDRLEGSGNSTALSVVRDWPLKSDPDLHFLFQSGIWLFPHSHNYRLNKYQMTDMWQFNFRVTKEFRGFFHGLHMEGLYSLKTALNQNEYTTQTAHNKTELQHFTLMFDYHF